MCQINDQSLRTEGRCRVFHRFLLEKKTLCALLNPRRFLRTIPAQLFKRMGSTDSY